MKFSIQKDEFIKILTDFSYVIKENSMKNFLSALLIEVKNNKITFKGTNAEIQYIKYSKCLSDSEGKILIKIPLLLEYIKLLDDDVISLEKIGQVLKVNNAEFSLMDENLYPELIENSSIVCTLMNAKKFSEMINKIKFVANSNSNDMIFNSINMLFSENKVELVCTDSYRLIHINENSEISVDRQALLTVESAEILSRILANINENISISIDSEKMIVTWLDSYISIKLLSLKFPDYKSLLNNFKSDKKIEFNKSEIISALKKVISVTKTSTDSKYIATFDFKGNLLHISGISLTAKINQKVSILKEGNDIKLSINCKYLKEFIEQLENNVEFYLSSPVAMIKIVELNSRDFEYFLMPVNIK